MTGQERRGPWRVVLIAGPTASGKSALALEIAERIGGVIINADSMQVYRDLRTITARPSPDDEARVPHRLYGHVDAAESYSAGRWLRDANAAIADVEASGRLPIVIGGTGLYFSMLTKGLATIPPIPDAVRDHWRARLAREGAVALHAELTRRDPAMAERLRPEDRTRIARALEVWEATGRSLSDWQRHNMPPIIRGNDAARIFLAPDREVLHRRIEARFSAMLAGGALDEVAALKARALDPLLPAMKAHGVPWLIRHLEGQISLEAAAHEAVADTRRYTKRQFTWFRNQLPDWPWVAPAAASDQLSRMLGA
ncbi:MAG: tRNA (adenosine(37)-N6)-dimethylallyltransferase MiaA [Variibacter sp.]